MKKARKPKFRDYTLDIYVCRTGEWLGMVAITATNAKEAIRQAKERHPGRNVKAVVAYAVNTLNAATAAA